MKKPVLLCIILFIFAAIVQALPRPVIKNISGTQVSNHPVTLSLSFCEGEVLHPLTLKLNGSTAASQWDLKRAWPGGSYKHVLVSFVLSALPARDSVRVTFDTAASPSNNTPISTASILATDFDAQASFVKGGLTYTVSARQLLQAADISEMWMSGPQATEFVLRGKPKTAAGVSDSDLCVQMEVRFFQGLSRARISFAIENTYETRMHNIYYDVALKLGNASPVQAFAQTGVKQYLRSRWRKVLVWGGALSDSLEIHNDIPYLITTGLIQRYNIAGNPLSSADKSNWLTHWANASKAIMGNGTITHYMPMTGERADIGPNPEWVVNWLFCQEKWAADIACGNAELAGSFPIHYRDASDTLRFISTQVRPRASLNWYCMGNRISDIPWNLDTSTTPFDPDVSHEPNIAYVPYLLTGELYFLEELYHWAAWNQITQYSNNNGYFSEQTRGVAWGLRTMAEVAAISPDAHAFEKSYFNWLVQQNITINDSIKLGVHGRSEFNGLGWWQDGSYDRGRGGCISIEADDHSSVFMDDFLTFIFDHIVDLGFDNAAPLREWKLRWATERFSNPTLFNPYLGVVADMPTRYKRFNGTDTIEYKINDIATQSAIAFDATRGATCVGVGPASAGYSVDSNLILNGWGSANANYARGVLSMYPRVTNPKTQTAWNFVDGRLRKSDVMRKWDFVPGPARAKYVTGIETRGLADHDKTDLAASPNPFNPAVTLRLRAMTPAARLIVYNVAGSQVADLTERARKGVVIWNAAHLPSGVYVVKLSDGKRSAVRKITLLK